MGNLNDQVAIITGAASGMGREIALLYGREGAKVVVSDLKYDTSKAVAEQIELEGGSAIAIVADVSKEEDVSRLIEETLKVYGTIDILVNNAGIMDNFEPVEAVTDEEWERVMGVNAFGPLRTIRKTMPIFKEKKRGIIINIASVGGLQGSRAGVVYTASKHALIGITKNIGYQYAGLGIRCNAIAPGAVKTNIGSSITSPHPFGSERAMSGMSINPRAGEPEEIARIALFLASDESSFVNGSVIVADSGWTAY